MRGLLRKYDSDRYLVAKQLIEPGEKILDIECGNGHMQRMVKNKFQELCGVDIAPFRLREAKKKIEELYPADMSRFKFIKGNADNCLPFPDNYFDTIICIAVIEHVYDIFFWLRSLVKNE